MDLICVDPRQVGHFWPHVEPLLRPAIENIGISDFDDIASDILDGQSLVWIAWNEKIKAAGKVAIAQTYKDTWSSQLFVLADFYNVQAAVPNFAADYTANKAKYATSPAAMAGFQRLTSSFSVETSRLR